MHATLSRKSSQFYRSFVYNNDYIYGRLAKSYVIYQIIEQLSYNEVSNKAWVLRTKEVYVTFGGKRGGNEFSCPDEECTNIAVLYLPPGSPLECFTTKISRSQKVLLFQNELMLLPVSENSLPKW